jgi:hypothetical protein
MVRIWADGTQMLLVESGLKNSYKIKHTLKKNEQCPLKDFYTNSYNNFIITNTGNNQNIHQLVASCDDDISIVLFYNL